MRAAVSTATLGMGTRAACLARGWERQQRRMLTENAVKKEELTTRPTKKKRWSGTDIVLPSTDPISGVVVGEQGVVAGAVAPVNETAPPNLRAFYVAKRINVVQVVQALFPRHRLFQETDSVVVSLGLAPLPATTGTGATVVKGRVTPGSEEQQQGRERYAIFFDYGAVVFLNCDSAFQEKCLLDVAQFCQGLIKKPDTEDFQIVVDPMMDDWSVFLENHIMVQKLDLNNIRVAASVIGQAAALSHFEQRIDNLLEEFDAYNEATAARHSGSFISGLLMTGKPLHVFKVLGEANDVMSSVILRLAILNRTKMRDTAWKYQKYHKVWEGLRDEFELEMRWEILEKKIGHLQQTMKFIIDGMHASKGHRSEMLIIVLIAAELGISLYTIV